MVYILTLYIGMFFIKYRMFFIKYRMFFIIYVYYYIITLLYYYHYGIILFALIYNIIIFTNY
jgi:hypothetical protein